MERHNMPITNHSVRSVMGDINKTALFSATGKVHRFMLTNPVLKHGAAVAGAYGGAQLVLNAFNRIDDHLNNA
jgi:hypothetical protein